MRNKTSLQVSGIAHCVRTSSGNIQILGKHKFDTFHQNVAAIRIAVRRNGDRFHTALIFHALGIDFRQDDAQRHPFPGTNIFHRYIQLHDASQRFELGIAQIHDKRILASADGQIHRNRALLRIYDDSAFYSDGGRRKSHKIPLRIRVVNRLVN